MVALSTLSGMSRTTGKTLSGIDHMRQSIADILTTSVGSRLCNRTYGSNLPDRVDDPLNEAGMQEIYADTATAIARDFPQIVLTQISLTQEEVGQVLISLTVHERGAGGASAPLTIDVPLTLTSPTLTPD